MGVGAALSDGETLKAITSQGVTLERAGQERQLALDLHAAPIDAVFTTLPIAADGDAGIEPSVRIPVAKPIPTIPETQQLSLLRQAALRTLADRAHHPP